MEIPEQFPNKVVEWSAHCYPGRGTFGMAAAAFHSKHYCIFVTEWGEAGVQNLFKKAAAAENRCFLSIYLSVKMISADLSTQGRMTNIF